MNEPLPREQAAAAILEDAGITTEPDGSEREPTPERHPFDDAPGDDAPDNETDDLEHDEQPQGTQIEDGDKPGDDPGDDVSDDAPGDPVNDLSSLAEKLETTVEDLYAMEIPLGGEDGSFTLGEIKDRFQDLRTLDDDKNTLALDKVDSENLKLVARQELQTVVAMLGDSISPELVDHARQMLTSEIARERDLTFEAIPEWQDQETAEREKKAINEYLRGYGFSEAELSQVYDHRLLKLARDAQQNTGRIRTASENVRPVRNPPGKPGKKQTRVSNKAKRQQKIREAAAGGPDEKLAGVKDLLSGE